MKYTVKGKFDKVLVGNNKVLKGSKGSERAGRLAYLVSSGELDGCSKMLYAIMKVEQELGVGVLAKHMTEEKEKRELFTESDNNIYFSEIGLKIMQNYKRTTLIKKYRLRVGNLGNYVVKFTKDGFIDHPSSDQAKMFNEVEAYYALKKYVTLRKHEVTING